MFIEDVEVKDIKGYEGKYAVSVDGRVWSYHRNRWLTNAHHHSGYTIVSLCKNGNPKSYSVHRLVAEAFIPNPNQLAQVNHKDENKLNNRVENLEWITCKDNLNYGTCQQRRIASLSKPVRCIETGAIYPSIK